ncbi:MAG: hypothetical protein V2A79_20295 [Planctomycetota bacterium]
MKPHRREWKHCTACRGPQAFLMLVVTLSGVGVAGCQATSKMRLGEQAERQGKYPVAYQYYCDEAKDRPSSGAVQAAIARVAPRAALHHEREAARAADAGNYAEAWKLYMQALAITPDNPALARLVQMLEEQHPAEIAPANAAWMDVGDRALATASTRSERPEPRVPARAEAKREPAPRATPPPAEPAPRTAGPLPTATDPRREPVETNRPSNEPDEAAVEGEEEPRGYLMTAVLSVNDHRFPRKTHTVDDIYVTLKDTDPDPADADLDVYLGTTRVRKARDIAPGRGVLVRGRSGKWYGLVVITVVDRTESVRIGIRPHAGPRG